MSIDVYLGYYSCGVTLWQHELHAFFTPHCSQTPECQPPAVQDTGLTLRAPHWIPAIAAVLLRQRWVTTDGESLHKLPQLHSL